MDFEDAVTFCKYFSDDEKIIDSIFKEKKIRFTQPAALNDPLEFQPILVFDDYKDNYRYRLNGILMPSKKDFYWIHIIMSRIDQFGILSLTSISDSFDMWSQYSNGHKGFLILLKNDFNKHPCMLSKDGKEYSIKKINYVEDYSIDMDEFINSQDGKVSAEINEKLFFNKILRWNHEREYRIVRPLTDSPDYKDIHVKVGQRDVKGLYLFDFSLECINSIIFGACMDVEKKKAIISFCNDYPIKFLQANLIIDEKDKRNKPSKIEIIPIEFFRDYFSMLHFIYDSRLLIDRQYRIDIHNIADLPYYKIDPKWVTQYYENRKNRILRNIQK